MPATRTAAPLSRLRLFRAPAVVWRLIALLAVAFFVTLLPPGLPARPDLVVIVVAAAALRHGWATGALVGLAGGWILDLIPPGGEPLGATALVLAAVGALMGTSARWARMSPAMPFLIVLAGGALVQGIRLVIALAQGTGGIVDPGRALWSVLLTGLFGLVLLPLFAQVERALDLRGWS